jgi:hypothetical protein
MAKEIAMSRLSEKVAFILIIGLLFTGGWLVVACGDDDDDEENDDETSYGNDIHGMYQVKIETTFSDCPVDTTNDGTMILSVEQGEDTSRADVYLQELGPSDEQLLFTGDVYGDTIVSFEILEENIGDGDCLQVQTVDYHLDIDTSTLEVNGHLYNNTFYMSKNNSCSASMVDCRSNSR